VYLPELTVEKLYPLSVLNITLPAAPFIAVSPNNI